MYRPDEAVDWDFIRDRADSGFVGSGVGVEGSKGGRVPTLLSFDVDDEACCEVGRSRGGRVVAGGTKGWVVWSALAAGRVKTRYQLGT